MNSRHAAHAAHNVTTDMNKTMNTSAIMQVAAAGNLDSPAQGAQPTGESGTFSQLLGSFRGPAVPSASASTGNNSSQMARSAEEAGANAMGSAPLASEVPTESAESANAPDRAEMPSPDAALIAALLGQIQAPYAMISTFRMDSAPAIEVTAAVSPLSDTGNIPTESNSAPALTIPQITAGLPVETAETPLVTLEVSRSNLPAPNLAGEVPTRQTSNVAPYPPSKGASDGAAPYENISGNGSERAAIQAHAADISRTPSEGIRIPDADLASEIRQTRITATPSFDTSEPPVERIATPAVTTGTPQSSSSADSALSNSGLNSTLTGTAIPQNFRDSVDSLNPAAGGDPSEVAAASPTLSGVRAPLPRGFAQTDPRERVSEALGVGSISGFPVAIHDDAPTQVTIAPRLDSPEWKPAFANGVRLLVSEGSSGASLQLNPAEFGPIDVRIQMVDKRADITFMVSNADANAALQAALPELREHLARGGIQLGQTSVGAHPQDGRQPGEPPRREATPDTASSASTNAALPTRPGSTSQIDTFA